MDDAPDEFIPLEVADAETRLLLGMFDTPAFARRGQELEYSLARLRDRCRRERVERLEMVRLRLRQWAGAVTGPDAWRWTFDGPIDALWPLTGADAPVWASQPAPDRRRRTIARDLAASLERFNRRWLVFLNGLDVNLINQAIELYNRYYLLEKECSLGSSRLAARHFQPVAPLTVETLLADYPVLPVPGLRP
jgi:hypothetical protein